MKTKVEVNNGLMTKLYHKGSHMCLPQGSAALDQVNPQFDHCISVSNKNNKKEH
jgi:hypothetical protein